jgi:hypothetical protein
MAIAADELLSFSDAARLLAGRLGITPRELCGYVMDDRLFSYTSCGERIFSIHLLAEWALTKQKAEPISDYLPTIAARCHFLTKDIETFDLANHFPEVIEEYRKTYGIEVVAEDGSVSLDISDISVPDYR